MTIPCPAPEGTLITVVHSPACHLCDGARLGLAELAREFPLSIEFVGCGEIRGQALVREHRAAMFPLILVDGVFFSSGRLPARKLRTLLVTRAPAAVG